MRLDALLLQRGRDKSNVSFRFLFVGPAGASTLREHPSKVSPCPSLFSFLDMFRHKTNSSFSIASLLAGDACLQGFSIPSFVRGASSLTPLERYSKCFYTRAARYLAPSTKPQTYIARRSHASVYLTYAVQAPSGCRAGDDVMAGLSYRPTVLPSTKAQP